MWAAPARSAPISKMFFRLGKFCIWMYTGGIRSVYGLYAILPAQGASGDDSQPSVARSAPTGGRERPLGSPQAIRMGGVDSGRNFLKNTILVYFYGFLCFFQGWYHYARVIKHHWTSMWQLRGRLRPPAGLRRPPGCSQDAGRTPG